MKSLSQIAARFGNIMAGIVGNYHQGNISFEQYCRYIEMAHKAVEMDINTTAFMLRLKHYESGYIAGVKSFSKDSKKIKP